MNKFFAKLLGRDRETAEQRAFRHEREKIISGVFTLPIVLTLAVGIGVALEHIQSMFIADVLLLAIELVLAVVFNWLLKLHQEKFGGD